MPENTDTLDGEILDAEDLNHEEPDNDNDESSEDTPSESEDGFESRYKDLQGAYTKSQQNNKQLERQIAELSGKMDAFVQMNEKPQVDWLDDAGEDDDADDHWRNDPAVARQAMKRFRSEMAELLTERDAYLLQEIGNNTQIDAELKGKMAELSEDPDFQGMPKKALMAVAKKLVGKKVIHTPPGKPGKGRKAGSGKASKIESNPMYQAMYEDYFEEDK